MCGWNASAPRVPRATYEMRMNFCLRGASLFRLHPSHEVRAIKRYLATREDRLPWLFLTRQAVNYFLREAGERAGLGRVWPPMLRHSCGSALANKGPTSASFRTTWVTAIHDIQQDTPAPAPDAARGSGTEPAQTEPFLITATRPRLNAGQYRLERPTSTRLMRSGEVVLR